jgi:hypothetical protein
VFFTGVIDLIATALAVGFVLIFLLVSFFTATLALTIGADFLVTGFTGVFDFETAVTFFSGVAFLATAFTEVFGLETGVAFFTGQLFLQQF